MFNQRFKFGKKNRIDINISFEQVNITSLTPRFFDEYDPGMCTYLLNHLTIANSLKECASRSPKDFKIITKNNTEFLFNKCLLSSVSETIFKLIQKDPSTEYYKLESDDPTNFMQKLQLLLQGDSVIFTKEERKSVRKIVGELIIDNIPCWLKPKKFTLEERSQNSLKTPQQSKISMSKKSFVSFIANRIIDFNPKYNFDSNENNYFSTQLNIDNAVTGVIPFETQFDEYDKKNDFFNIRAPKLDFEIKTQKNSYKCTLIAALCSDVIFSKIQVDPSTRSFYYDYDDEKGSFKVVADFLNGCLYELGPENIELSIKFATDLGIKPLLTELEKAIFAFKLRISNLKENSYLMNDVLFLQKTLLSITEENVESSYNSIINSIWCDSKDMVNELSSNINLISSISFKSLRALSKLFKKLISSDSISKKPFLSNLLSFFMKNFSFVETFLSSSTHYQIMIKGKYNFNSMQFLLMLKEEGVLSSYDIVSNWPTACGSIYESDNNNWSNSPYHPSLPYLPKVINYFAKEVSEVNKDVNYGDRAIFSRIRMIYEDKDTLTNSIFNDNIELFMKLTSKSGNDKFNFDNNIFCMYEYEMAEIPMIDFAAVCGSFRIFRYLAVDKKVTIDFRTLYMAIKGRSEEILEYFTGNFVNDQRKSLLEKLNEDFRKWIFNSQKNFFIQNRADDENSFANLKLYNQIYMNPPVLPKYSKSFLFFSVQMHSHAYFEALCKISSNSEIRNALILSVDNNNFRAFSYIINNVGVFNYFKGIDIIAERCALYNNTDFLRVIFNLFDKEKLIGTSIENPPILFINGSVRNSHFYLPSCLIAASQTGNIRLTKFIKNAAESLPKKKILPVLTAAFNSAINRNFDLFQFYIDQFGIVLDDSSLTPLVSHLFLHKKYQIVQIVYNYYLKNGFTQSKTLINYLIVGAIYLNDDNMAKELIQKMIQLNNNASFEEAYTAAAVNGNIKLCNFLRSKPITIDNVDFIQAVIDIIDNNSINTLKLFISLILVEKRANAVKNGLLHSIRYNKAEFVNFFVDNFLKAEQGNNQNGNENENTNENDNENDNNNENENNDNDNNENDNNDMEENLINNIGVNVHIGAVPLIFVNAAFYGYLNVIKAMVAFDSTPLFINTIVDDFGSALCAAVTSGHEDIIDFLLSMPGIELGVFNSNYETPLVIAAKHHNYSLFTKLLNFVLDPSHQSSIHNVKIKDQLNLSFCNFISTFNFNKEYFLTKNKLLNEDYNEIKGCKLAVLPIIQTLSYDNSEHVYPWKQYNKYFNFYKKISKRLFCYIMPEYYQDERKEINASDDEKFIQFFANCDSIDYGFNQYGCNFLIAAVRSKNYEIIKLLLKKEKTDVNFSDSFGMTAAMYAVINDSLDILKLLVENGEKSDESNKKVDINRCNYYERTALVYAVYRNNFDIVRYILNQPSFDAEKGKLLLSIAVSILCKRKKMTNFLLDYSNSNPGFSFHKKINFCVNNEKCDYRLNIKTYKLVSRSILDIVIFYGDINILKSLYNCKGFDQTKFNQAKILYLAASSDKLEVFKYLLEHFQSSNNDNSALFDVNYEYKGKSLLFASIFTNYLGITDYILNHPDFDPIKSNAILALCKAIIEKDTVKARMIANAKGIDINGQCPHLKMLKSVENDVDEVISNRPEKANFADGFTPLAIASTIDYNFVQLLLELPGIDVNARSEDGSTPIFSVCGLYEMELLVRQKNIDLNAQNNAGLTCLMHFIFHRLQRFVFAVLKIGADPSIKDKEGKTILDYFGPEFKDVDISKMNWREISQMILKAMSQNNF